MEILFTSGFSSNFCIFADLQIPKLFMFCLDEFVGGHVELYLTLCCCCSYLYADIPYFAQNGLVWTLWGGVRKENEKPLKLVLNSNGWRNPRKNLWFYKNGFNQMHTKIVETI